MILAWPKNDSPTTGVSGPVSLWVAVLLWALGLGMACGGATPSTVNRAPLEPRPVSQANNRVDIPFVPTWSHLSVAGQGAYLYLESAHGRGRWDAWVMVAGPDYDWTKPAPLAAGFVDPFGEPILSEGALWMAVVSDAGESGATWELWRWSPGDGPTHVVSCRWDQLADGRLAPAGGDLVVLREWTDGSLRAARIEVGGSPGCPPSDGWTTLVEAPMPSGYDWYAVGDELAVVGRWGESYVIRTFDAGLRARRRVQLAVGTAGGSGDIALETLPSMGPLAIYTARVGGVADIYLSPLDPSSGRFRAGPLPAQRIVASAEPERRPRMLEVDGHPLVWWQVRDAAGNQLELVARLPTTGVTLPGGEVMWRYPVRRDRRFLSAWTSDGLLRVAVFRDDVGGVIETSHYIPTFWPRGGAEAGSDLPR